MKPVKNICSDPCKNHTLKNFAYLILLDFELYTREVCVFLKN